MRISLRNILVDGENIKKDLLISCKPFTHPPPIVVLFE